MTIFRGSRRAAGQPLDSDLTAIAALTTTAAGLALLDDANAAAQRTTLGLGSAAVEAASATKTASTVAMWDAARDLQADDLHLEAAIDFTAAATIAPTVSAGVGKTMSLRAGAAAAGNVGGNCTVGPSDGGTPGTNAPGNLLLEVGTAVANASGKTIWQEAGTQTAILQRTASGVTLRSGTGNPLSGSGGANYLNLDAFGINLLSVTDNTIVGATAKNLYMRWASTFALIYDVESETRAMRLVGRNASVINTATTTMIKTHATTTNKGSRAEAHVTITDDTANETANAKIEFAWRNVAGTVTLVGTPVIAYLSDAGQAGVTVTVTVSTTDILINVVTPDTNTRHADCTIDVLTNRTLA